MKWTWSRYSVQALDSGHVDVLHREVGVQGGGEREGRAAGIPHRELGLQRQRSRI